LSGSSLPRCRCHHCGSLTVDLAGHVIIATAFAPLDGRNTLVFGALRASLLVVLFVVLTNSSLRGLMDTGSDDAGRTVLDKSNFFREQMKQLAAKVRISAASLGLFRAWRLTCMRVCSTCCCAVTQATAADADVADQLQTARRA
jgi:hypothetical protein